MLAPQFIESALRSVYASDKISDLKFDPYAKIDAKVQAVLDEYWPGTTGLKSLKRAGDKQVYKAMYGDQKVVVKSVGYDAALEVSTIETMNFVNYLSEELSVAYYVTPGVKPSDDMEELITVSRFAPGVAPESFGPDAPWSWIGDEAAVKANGAWWGQFRHRSMKFAVERPEQYEALPLWNEINAGWEAQFTPLDIPMTPENWGIIHGDAHTGNWMIDTTGVDQYSYTVIDWDNSQKNFFLVDVGTIVWVANMQLYYYGENGQPVPDYQTHLDNFKSWFLEGYGWTVDAAQLTACCARRREFMYYYYKDFVLPYTIPGTDDHKAAVGYMDAYEAGSIPSC